MDRPYIVGPHIGFLTSRYPLPAKTPARVTVEVEPREPNENVRRRHLAPSLRLIDGGKK